MQIEPQDIFATINQVRDNPNIIINQIKDQLKRFQSNVIFRTKKDARIRTISGKAAWQEAILAIERQKTKASLNWNSLLSQALEEYKQVVMEDESINPFQVIKNFCSYEGNISFNMNESNTEEDLQELVAGMIIGDGDQKKGSRTAIFHPLFKEFACAVLKKGSKLTIYTVYAQSVSEPQKSAQKSSSAHKTSSNSKNEHNVQNSSKASKYKQNENELSTKESYIKKGKELIAELNKIRKQPKQYIHAIKAEIQKFKDQKTLCLETGVITTKEGQAPYLDLISELEAQFPLPTMREIGGLTIVCLEQLLTSEALNQDKTPVEQILDKFCLSSEGIRSIKLNDIQGLSISTMLMRLLTGDGDRKRTARRKMLSPICKVIGCTISRNTLVLNIGQMAKDNQTVVEDYLENLDAISTKPQIIQNKSNEKDLPYFGQSPKGKVSTSDERVVTKKTSKSRSQKRGGRMYKITNIEIVYDDGTMEQIVEEDLIN